MADYDLIGNIAIIKGEGKSRKEKLEQARSLLEKPLVETVLEKASNVKGRLRKIDVKHVAGRRNLIASYRENGCLFKFDVSSCYFSPRLANERQKIASKIKMKDKVLVMFAGVGVYPIVIYKIKKPRKIVGVEIGKDCCKWFKENLKLNKISPDKISIIQGDVKKKIDGEFIKKFGKFDVVMMPRPNLKESFLKWGLLASKRRTRLIWYGFCRINEKDDMIKKLEKEANKLGYKVKIIDVVKVGGEIAPFKHRYRVEMIIR